ncbi:UPF0061-domain-containing protein [Peniophora sp. CONT]|nr:UPF0061-domain-containing protein [Peniophora sp. CONT]
MLLRRAMSTAAKKPINALPLPPPTDLLIHNLTADPITPTVPAFKHFLQETPSLQRRARLLDKAAHFSHVAPLPLPFPFEIEPPDDPSLAEDRGKYIEMWLACREAVHPRPDAKTGEDELQVLYADEDSRDKQETVLLALSRDALNDCLPQLDIGDALDVLGSGSLSECGPPHQYEPAERSEAVKARETLVDVLGGRAVLMTPEDADVSFAPWSLRYSGHQFGSWAGQLGDGRAISILATPHPSKPDEIWEVQLKGAGRTPFSRSADGLAVVRSSIREYLCAEAMQALGIPTTRSLSLVSLPKLPVIRERQEAACITSRMAPSFIRIGNFEALNPPTRMFFFGGGQQEADLEALRVLGEWVADRVLRVEKGEGGAWGKQILLESARRNARMVAGWQAYGFMHGVINTDNVSILGLTIDYGPYAFMDVFDDLHICNHTDDSGRYAYKHQPAMILFALKQLLNALAPLIGAELAHNSSVKADWAKDASEEQTAEWTDAAKSAVEPELYSIFREEYDMAYDAHMRDRLGLKTTDETDDAKLFSPLFAAMADQKLDFHMTFRHLAGFKPSIFASEEELTKFIDDILAFTSRPEWIQRDTAVSGWVSWLKAFSDRIENDGQDEVARCETARKHNPRFVLRQWVLEEVIARTEADHVTGRRLLNKVMQMACAPFDKWGAEGDERPEDELDVETKEERRFCGVGSKEMLGFQCSCSS